MAALKRDYTIERGVDFKRKFRLVNKLTQDPIDLTGYSGRMHARNPKDDEVKLLDFTDINGGIILGGALGTIEIVYLGGDSKAILWKEAEYDLELTSSTGGLSRFLQGKLTVDYQVTR